ncbi:MAG: ribosome recycling factor [Aerococcus sp.]|nr:ribosome recycling factor [Aerococcus sp.]
MAIKDIINDTKSRMAKTAQSLRDELAQIRAGVANAGLLNGVMVDYYGAPTPLNQIASITIPEARMLMVTPYDKTALDDIDRALQQADLGVSPTNDGDKIRIVIPALTKERREELTKVVGKDLEQAKVATRHIRRDANDAIKKAEKNNEITEDDRREYEDEIQKLTDQAIANLEEIADTKDQEIREH